MNSVTIKKSNMAKGIIGIAVIGLLAFALITRMNIESTNTIRPTGLVIDDGISEVTTTLQGFQYAPDTIKVKEGDLVRLTIQNRDNVNHGLHLPQFGIIEGIPPGSTKTVEFIAKETPSNGQAVPTCTQEHGEKLNIIVEA